MRKREKIAEFIFSNKDNLQTIGRPRKGSIGLTVQQIANLFEVSERTVQQIKKVVKTGEGPLFIYFLLWEEGDAVKIGRGTSLRVQNLQSILPFDSNVIAQIEVSSREEATLWESHLHRLFNRAKIRGEWFRYSGIKDDIQELFRKKSAQKS